MTSRFEDFMPFIFEWEGGYDNDPDDPGGETKYGIDKRSHPREDIKNLTKARAKQTHWEEYWTSQRCDDLPERVGEIVMNIGVNAGKVRAGKWLQHIVGAEEDGRIGSKTVAAAIEFAGTSHVLAVELLDRTEEHYRSIARGRLAKFLRGWLNRNNALREYLKLT